MSGSITVGGKILASHDNVSGKLSMSGDVVFPAGHVVQVVTNTMDDVYAITDTVDMQEIMSCSITTKYQNSKITINMTAHLWHTNYNTGKVCIFRNSTRIGVGTDTTNTFGGSQGEYGIGIRPGQYTSATAGTGQSWSANPYGLIYTDTPGVIGTYVYALKGTCGNSASNPLYVNRGSSTDDSPRPVSTITLMEIIQ
jgi:hypothetical protein